MRRKAKAMGATGSSLGKSTGAKPLETKNAFKTLNSFSNEG